MTQQNQGTRKRTRLVRPYPVHTLEEALALSFAIQESNAGLPFDRKLLAGALRTTPASSGYTMRLNSSAKYGLTQGAYNDERISLTPRGEAIVAPKGDSERQKALVEAAMQPDVFRRFYEMLDGKHLPEDTYARNVLQRELGVHPDLTGECLDIIKSNGLYAGILREEQGSLVIKLSGSQMPTEPPSRSGADGYEQEEGGAPREAPGPLGETSTSGKVFVGYSGDIEAAQFAMSVLDQFGIPHGSPDDSEDSGRPISAQASEELRSSGAAILVFASDPESDGSASPEFQRILFQLGAASALYGDRVVVFREAGLDLGFDPGTLHCVEFEKGRHAESGLALLRELHRAGIISIGV